MSKKKKKVAIGTSTLTQRRCHRLVITLNEEELTAIDNYCKRYKRGTHTKTRIVRELILSQMMLRYQEDTPMLFSESEMR